MRAIDSAQNRSIAGSLVKTAGSSTSAASTQPTVGTTTAAWYARDSPGWDRGGPAPCGLGPVLAAFAGAVSVETTTAPSITPLPPPPWAVGGRGGAYGQTPWSRTRTASLRRR